MQTSTRTSPLRYCAASSTEDKAKISFRLPLLGPDGAAIKGTQYRIIYACCDGFSLAGVPTSFPSSTFSSVQDILNLLDQQATSDYRLCHWKCMYRIGRLIADLQKYLKFVAVCRLRPHNDSPTKLSAGCFLPKTCFLERCRPEKSKETLCAKCTRGRCYKSAVPCLPRILGVLEDHTLFSTAISGWGVGWVLPCLWVCGTCSSVQVFELNCHVTVHRSLL